ncbi:hypothetical protein VSX64_20030 [Aurantimonas sp. C2-6-R+9]|uniref:hypothetical protein n=1 Tax=unclassified Aurantimonas TaxID=2638230 RepID=UPI002E17D45A|nr:MULTISPECIES: hypothetical protein [unclassified Aurantimonas]MEC5292896.1 hypothetical protein [Aurantimonas sp. C2-3-R2]MEC5383117.1 hypothetical protein [Aurantimonas sp. C2-6-R+9]MEC5414016.1 hypothetical protein [Aurantimonas sp. C2-4-R8]
MRYLRFLYCVAVAIPFLSTVAIADHSREELDSLCQSVKQRADESSWLAMDEENRITPLLNGNSHPSSSVKYIYYIHSRSDGRNIPTVIGVKISYSSDEEIDPLYQYVDLWDNVREEGFDVEFPLYQGFHLGKARSEELRVNWHFTDRFLSRSRIRTFEPLRRRQKMAFGASDAKFIKHRAYLFTYGGVRADGSCVPFQTFLTDDSKKLSIEVTDLRELDERPGAYDTERLTIGIRW